MSESHSVMIEMIAALRPMPAPAHRKDVHQNTLAFYNFTSGQMTQRSQPTDDGDYEPGLRRGE